MATTTPSPRPPTTLVAANATACRSASGAPGGSASAVAASGTDSPVSALRSRSSRSARSNIPRTQQDDVARHELLGVDLLDLAAAPDPGTRRRCVAERLEGAVSAVFGDHVGPDDRDEPAKDQQAVADLAERDGQGPGDQQQDHERLRGRFHDHRGDRGSPGGLQCVRSVLLGTVPDLIWFEANGAVDAERCRDLVARQRVCGTEAIGRGASHRPHDRATA